MSYKIAILTFQKFRNLFRIQLFRVAIALREVTSFRTEKIFRIMNHTSNTSANSKGYQALRVTRTQPNPGYCKEMFLVVK